jgi:hypothetical protein
MKHYGDIALRDLIDGFLFSLRAEGKSNATIEYYSYFLNPLLTYVTSRDWANNLRALDTVRLREFLTWVGTRTYELRRLLAVCDLDTRTGARFTGIRNKAMLLLLHRFWTAPGRNGTP